MDMVMYNVVGEHDASCRVSRSVFSYTLVAPVGATPSWPVIIATVSAVVTTWGLPPRQSRAAAATTCSTAVSLTHVELAGSWGLSSWRIWFCGNQLAT